MSFAKGNIPLNLQTEGKFWSRVDMSGGPDACWPWLGATNSGGYGSVGWDGKVYSAHRVAAFLKDLVPTMAAPKKRNGPGHILHKCDNPPCCNSAHFLTGTYRDNMLDMYAKGRHVVYRGASHTNAKFTVEEAQQIRNEYKTIGSIAAVARLHPQADESVIAKIIKGRTYVVV